MPLKMFRHLLALAILVIAAAAPATAWAQAGGGTSDALIAERRQMIDAWSAEVESLEREVADHAEDDPKLVETRLRLGAIEAEVLRSSVAFRPLLSEINARMEAIGPPPADGRLAEPAVVAGERQELIAGKDAHVRGPRARGILVFVGVLRPGGGAK